MRFLFQVSYQTFLLAFFAKGEEGVQMRLSSFAGQQ